MKRMVANSPEHAVELLDQAFNEGDLEAVLGLYEEAAVVVTEPGKSARGTAELRSFFQQALQSGSSAKQLKTHVIEADGVALFLSHWTLSPRDADPGVVSRTFMATTVFRKQADQGWKALIDNSFGPLVLGPEQAVRNRLDQQPPWIYWRMRNQGRHYDLLLAPSQVPLSRLVP